MQGRIKGMVEQTETCQKDIKRLNTKMREKEESVKKLDSRQIELNRDIWRNNRMTTSLKESIGVKEKDDINNNNYNNNINHNRREQHKENTI